MSNLICFTNCLLVTETGQFARRDLWIDEEKGVILDAQKQFYHARNRPAKIIDLGGNILSPGFLDIQINGAYGFDFSVYDGDEATYQAGLDKISSRIVETGVTSLVPTIITQEKSFYPTLLPLLSPSSKLGSAHRLGWHAEGPFLQMSKRGAHDPNYILSAPEGIISFESIYGAEALSPSSPAGDELDTDTSLAHRHGIRIITAAPEVPSVLSAISELTSRGITISIGHSVANSSTATEAVKQGANLITHLFNAMPILHHRDPGIVGLLGASPASGGGTNIPLADEMKIDTPAGSKSERERKKDPERVLQDVSEALTELPTPPRSPVSKPRDITKEGAFEDPLEDALGFDRPFYEMIVDGVHSHPNSVRLAYMSHRDGCILITDAMMYMDPHLADGAYDWRDGRRVVKEGVKLYLEGSDTLAGSVVSMDTCVRNFSKFTGCNLAQAIKCATFNPARCLHIENKKGSLRPGADADLVILDKTGRVLTTWVSGRKAWGFDF